MSVLGMNRVLHSVYVSAEQARRLKEEPEALLADYDLTDRERRAIAELDYRTLLQEGAHPFLMYKTALRMADPFTFESLKQYIGSIHGLELRDIVT